MNGRGGMPLLLIALLAAALLAAMFFTWLELGEGRLKTRHGVHSSAPAASSLELAKA